LDRPLRRLSQYTAPILLCFSWHWVPFQHVHIGLPDHQLGLPSPPPHPPQVRLNSQYKQTTYPRITSTARYTKHVHTNIDILNNEFRNILKRPVKKYYSGLWHLSVATVGVYDCHLMIFYEGENWIDLAQDEDKWRALVNVVMNVQFSKLREHLDQLSRFRFSISTLFNNAVVFISSWSTIIIIWWTLCFLRVYWICVWMERTQWVIICAYASVCIYSYSRSSWNLWQ
jgi:hypothetical protein